MLPSIIIANSNCSHASATHPVDPKLRTAGCLTETIGKPITIGNNVWLGANVVVNCGVTIGDNVVVGAGSVVLKDIPANCVYAGSPAKFIKSIE